jgi:hypothetical protein
LIVKLRDGADVNTVARAHGLALGYAGRNNASTSARQRRQRTGSAAALRSDARVQYAEPNYLRQPTAIDSRCGISQSGGLNMKFTTGQSKGQFIPSSYASNLDADEDNVENYATGAAMSSSGRSTPAWI